MNNDVIFEPKKEYSKFLEEIVNESSNFFDNLKENSSIDEEINQKAVSLYKEKESLANKENKLISSVKIKIGLLIALIIISIISTIYLYNEIQNINYIPLLIISFLIIVIISIVLIVKISKKLSTHEEQYKKLIEEKEQYKKQAYQSIENLLKKFDNETPLKIIKKACPLLILDKEFDIKKYSYMKKKYGLLDITDKNRSIYHILSGSISGNPFFYQKIFETYMTSQTYTGSLMIYWTEQERDSQGNVITVQRSELLTASITRPKPAYHMSTSLIYANDAAPNLNFSRKPTGLSGKSEKEIENYVKRYTKKLERKENRDINNDRSDFQIMGNEEFDCIFNAINRDNEREFRLLFTPLAQKNILSLLKDKEPFGDDFNFKKRGCINIITSSHSQNSDLFFNPTNYLHFDITNLKSLFISYMKEVFTNIYFDIAPLISIPLYQEMKNNDKEYDDNYIKDYNFTSYEDESFANKFDVKLLSQKGTSTNTILKVNGILKSGKADIINIRAYSYRAEHRSTIEMVHGGDGNLHAVPIEYIEYIPITKDTFMSMYHSNMNKEEFENILRGNEINKLFKEIGTIKYSFRNGILALITDTNYNSSVVQNINKIINK